MLYRVGKPFSIVEGNIRPENNRGKKKKGDKRVETKMTRMFGLVPFHCSFALCFKIEKESPFVK